jgi:hypothetical protein
LRLGDLGRRFDRLVRIGAVDTGRLVAATVVLGTGVGVGLAVGRWVDVPEQQ